MNQTTRILHLFVALSLVLLPMREVMADFSVMSAGPEIQTVSNHGDAHNHNPSTVMSDGMLAATHPQMDKSSTDCHDHNMTDCDACTLHFALKKDTEISGLSITLNLYTDYSVPVVTLVLSNDIRPPIS
jgi:hypothetical protein